MELQSLVFLAMEALTAGHIEVATQRAIDALEFGITTGTLALVAESKRMLGMATARRGEYAESEKLLEDAAVAFRDLDDRSELAMTLGSLAWSASERGDLTTALRQLSEALRLSREAGMGERALRVLQDGAFILWRQRSREAAVLWDAAKAAAGHLPRWAAKSSSTRFLRGGAPRCRSGRAR